MSDDSNDLWTMATAEEEGMPLIFRIRNGAPAFARKDAFQQLLGVVWEYDPVNDQGMPSQDTVEQMTEFEDLLLPAFENAQQAFLTVVVTGNGVREWQWYARDVEEAMTLVNATLGECEPFPVQFGFQEDPEWEGYEQFLELMAEE